MVQATLNFYLEPEKGGHAYFSVGTAGSYRRKFDQKSVEITDINGLEQDYTLETHGFQFCKQILSEKTFQDEVIIRSTVYGETESLIKNITGATRVHIFEHSIRRASREAIQKKVDTDPNFNDDNTPVTDVGPARVVHTDFSDEGALDILHNNMPSDLAAELAQKRWSIINVWRPIKPITKDPITVCDSFSVEDDDLIPIPMAIPGKRPWSVNYLRYRPEQAWYYRSAMTPEDVLLFKNFDSTSKRETVAKRVPHTSFDDARTRDDANRESIEMRCLVFWENGYS
ncbi:hypothetical protein BM221_008949 [Beauveria bassiana]|uniref:Methyltransferase n=1 Tax=Beauveria bassiana TaxID=176275 RepID=A0A2N6NE79_BEABA|nr:hypothetical protein BM221_008949 [Beauveria bassiana]